MFESEKKILLVILVHLNTAVLHLNTMQLMTFSIFTFSSDGPLTMSLDSGDLVI